MPSSSKLAIPRIMLQTNPAHGYQQWNLDVEQALLHENAGQVAAGVYPIPYDQGAGNRYLEKFRFETKIQGNNLVQVVLMSMNYGDSTGTIHGSGGIQADTGGAYQDVEFDLDGHKLDNEEELYLLAIGFVGGGGGSVRYRSSILTFSSSPVTGGAARTERKTMKELLDAIKAKA